MNTFTGQSYFGDAKVANDDTEAIVENENIITTIDELQNHIIHQKQARKLILCETSKHHQH